MLTIDLPDVASQVRAVLADRDWRRPSMVLRLDGEEYVMHVARGGTAERPLVLSVLSPRRAPWRNDAELRSRYGLSARQIEIARLLADRCSNKEIARRLGISVHTAGSHIRVTMLKLGVHRRCDGRVMVLASPID